MVLVLVTVTIGMLVNDASDLFLLWCIVLAAYGGRCDALKFEPWRLPGYCGFESEGRKPPGYPTSLAGILMNNKKECGLIAGYQLFS